jgi:hypothetical protein
VAIPDPEKQFEVEVDASQDVASGCLLQRDEKGRLRLIACFAHKFDDTERRYPTPDKELMAIVLACKHWRHHLLGARHQVVVHSDHKNLLPFTLTKRLTDRQFRWLKEVCHVDMVIKHIKGRDNGRADAISRRPDLMRNETEVADDPPMMKTNNQGHLIPAEALINMLLSIMENPTEMENFKKAYPEDPRLEN